MQNLQQHIAIIGGGITGVTSAYTLAKAGYRVTLIEKNRYAGMETSYANGGQLSASNAEVWTHPSTLIKGLKWMFTKDAPLLMNPTPTWHKLSWMAEFVAAIPRYRDNTIATTRLAIAARQHLFSWAEAEGIDFNHERKGILHIYRNRAGFEHAGTVSKLLAAGGLERRAVTPEEMRAIEPTLQGNYYGGYFTESDSTGDIHKFTHGLSLACERLGVRTLYGRDVVRTSANGQTALIHMRNDQGGETLVCDAVVVCAGVQGRALAAQLGDRLNIYPVKGYSITVDLEDSASQQAAPMVSLLDDETKLVTSRLGADRFRVAGTAEFNGINRDIRAERIRPLVNWVNQCFPGVNTRRVEPWAGLRPMLPNMLPRVGPGRQANVFYNTGHGHLGWTLSAITAHQLAGHVQAHFAPKANSFTLPKTGLTMNPQAHIRSLPPKGAHASLEAARREA
jgi:D-amino-acid dehydrogenase